MSKDWIMLNSRSGVKRYVQVKHISCFGTDQEGHAFIGIAGNQDPIVVRERLEEIRALLGIPNDPAQDI